MKNRSIENSSYSHMVYEIQKVLEEGLERAQKAYDREKIITYWKIGKSIAQYIYYEKNRADYGEKLFKNLSKDLNIGYRLLHQMTQFYQTYPEFEPSLNLKWSHYRLLATVKDPVKRYNFEQKASSRNLSEKGLNVIVKNSKVLDSDSVLKKKSEIQNLRSVRGKLYTYKIVKQNFTENTFVDLGFNISKDLGGQNVKGNFLESLKKGKKYNIKSVKALRKHIYTYKAYIDKFVDGDTLWLKIDLGFNVWFRHKLRLRGIYAPEKDTKQGQLASEYVKAALKGLPFVVIKSHGRDKWGRHLMDIFYLRDENDPYKVLEYGNFLNQEMLDNDLASFLS